MLEVVGAKFGLDSSWQAAWGWFAATYPSARYPIVIAGVAAGLLIFWRTARMPAGRFVGTFAAVLIAAMAVAPGPVIGAVLGVIDVALSAAVGLVNHG